MTLGRKDVHLSEGTADDCKVDFDSDANRPAICWECRKEFPISQLDPTDSDPTCPQCKYAHIISDDEECDEHDEYNRNIDAICEELGW